MNEAVDRVPGEKLLYSPAEACAALSMSRAALYRLLQRGTIRSVSVGRSRRILADSLREYVQRLAEAQGVSGPDVVPFGDHNREVRHGRHR